MTDIAITTAAPPRAPGSPRHQRRTAPLAFALGLIGAMFALGAPGADWTARDTSEDGWSTAPSCVRGDNGHAQFCWTQTRGHDDNGHEQADLIFYCWPGNAEEIILWFQANKGFASTQPEPTLTVRWDDGPEQALATVNESAPKKKYSKKWLYRYSVLPKRHPGFGKLLRAHQTLHILLPYQSVEPRWSAFRMHNVKDSLAAARAQCRADATGS